MSTAASSSGLWDLVRESLARDPTAVVLEDADGLTWTAGELIARVRAWGGALRRLGVAPGDRVATLLGPTPGALAVYLATLRTGAVSVPWNPALPRTQIEWLLGDARPRVVVCEEARASELGEAVDEREARLATLADFEHEHEHEHEHVDHEDVAAIVYTSGTTGRPKGAVLTHGNLRSNAEALTAVWRFRGDDVLLHALPLFHVHGLFVACHCALLAGAKILMLGKFRVDAVVEALPRATVMMGVPTFYHRLLGSERFDRERCRGMRLFTSGSAPLASSTARRFRERTGHRLFERYGMTETLITTAVPLDAPRPGSVGRAVRGVELRVTSIETGRPVERLDEVGQVEVRGETLFQGYWNQPERRAASMREVGWFVTGDLGRLDEDGALWLAGRSTELVITGGENVYPLEVEAALADVEGVAEAAVVGIPDDDLGESLQAAVVPDSGPVSLEPESVRESLRSRLAPHQVPRRVHLVEALPRNAMGKVVKSRLRDDLLAGAPGPLAPLTPPGSRR